MFPFKAVDQRKVLYTPKRAEIYDELMHPTDKTVLGVIEYYHKPEVFAVNGTFKDDLQYLLQYGSIESISMSLDMKTWLVRYVLSDGPDEFFLYRSEPKEAEFLFSAYPELTHYNLSRQIGFDFKSRDGLTLQAYLSLPPDAALRTARDAPASDLDYVNLGMLPVDPQKLVVLVHGGPEIRDHYGYSGENIFLTNRGYAVLQVNYRGSTGFGKRFLNAGNGEWARKMHLDILDSVKFVVTKGIANKSQVAVMGK
ncbi:hypothetical protein COOONC_17079 [Cooperia oncophora]